LWVTHSHCHTTGNTAPTACSPSSGSLAGKNALITRITYGLISTSITFTNHLTFLAASPSPSAQALPPRVGDILAKLTALLCTSRPSCFVYFSSRMVQPWPDIWAPLGKEAATSGSGISSAHQLVFGNLSSHIGVQGIKTCSRCAPASDGQGRGFGGGPLGQDVSFLTLRKI
jgi:hypothetical protein